VSEIIIIATLNMTHITTIQHNLERNLDGRISTSFDPKFPTEVLQQLLADKRSINTRRAYEGDVRQFFKFTTGKEITPDLVLEFLHLERTEAVAVVLGYKAFLIQQELKEATVNRRLSAIKSLVAMGRKLGVCAYTLEDIKGEKVERYRDTSGIDSETFKRVLAQCDRSTLGGKRDYALLRLLWGNALRRNEVSQLNVGDFDPQSKKLRILGKGRGTQAQFVALSLATIEAIADWLAANGNPRNPAAPLFIALDFHAKGRRLTGNGLRDIVVRLCASAGVEKVMSPHRIRHSAITAALNATGGNVRKVQALSRHKNLETLMIYDDNRNQAQAEVSDILDDLIDPGF
jgi:integrase/recombinase XerC